MVSLKKVLFHQSVDVYGFRFNKMCGERSFPLCTTYVEVIESRKLSSPHIVL
jgi:hypothetical protein